MNIEAMGKQVSEALALQGKADSLAKEVEELEGAISGYDRDLRRLQAISNAREVAVTNLGKLGGELGKCKAELEDRLGKMKNEGIELPLGSKVQVRPGRL